MSPDRHGRVKDVFVAACELAAGQRSAYLDAACGDDADLRREVERLLGHHRPAEADETRALRAEAGDTAGTAACGEPDEAAPEFPPGHVLAGRYRVVALLGAGGMGSVYRAEDMQLGLTVALKLLPREAAASPLWRRRFLQETRLAREITHPNVCRVHDIGELDGRYFISMEYVDGEDLASLLRRIGRLSSDKAIDVARQLCAGVAAAHVRGVLHRDLKPANVMLDGRGRVRITDFGLSEPAGASLANLMPSGTPRYMAPEQLSGRGASERSDLYALGLVLYEIFTGRPAFTADSAGAYAALQLEARPPAPSSIVAGLDRQIEGTIMACLEKDPAARPESALAVAASLPGGDLLAEALAIGELPSPDMVATAGRSAAMSRRAAAAAVAGLLAALGLIGWLGTTDTAEEVAAEWKPAAVLLDRARGVSARLGFGRPGDDEAVAFATDRDLHEMSVCEETAARSPTLGLTPRTHLFFWYRRAGASLTPATTDTVFHRGARTTLADPPMTAPSLRMVVDATGRLVWYEAMLSAEGPATEPDWGPLFEAAGIEAASLRPASPLATPRWFADARAAWELDDPRAAGASRRIEAASLGGRPTYFAVLEPHAADDPAWAQETIQRVFRIRGLRILLGIVLLIVAVPLAGRQTRGGTADHRGAMRVGGFVAGLRLLTGLLLAHHDRTIVGEMLLLAPILSLACFEGFTAWLTYLALEPFVRRFWPHALLAWNRIVLGRVWNQVVGSSLVVGVLVGVVWRLMFVIERLAPHWLGWASRGQVVLRPELDAMLGGRFAAGVWLDALQRAVYQGMFLALLVALIRKRLKNGWIATVVATLVLLPVYVPLGSHLATSVAVIGVGVVGLGVWLLMRFGLAAFVCAIVIASLLGTPSISDWSPSHGLGMDHAALLLTGMLFAFGFAAATAGSAPQRR